MFSRSFFPLLFTLPRLASYLEQIRSLRKCRGRAGMWAPWTVSPRWRKKNSQRISGLTWVCMSAHLCTPASACVCVCAHQREMSGQMSLLGLLWVSACSDKEMRQIMCINQWLSVCSLQRHDTLPFSDSLQFVSVAVQVVQERLHEDPLDYSQPVCTKKTPSSESSEIQH